MCKWIVDADQLEMNDFNNEIEILCKTDVVNLFIDDDRKIKKLKECIAVSRTETTAM